MNRSLKKKRFNRLRTVLRNSDLQLIRNIGFVKGCFSGIAAKILNRTVESLFLPVRSQIKSHQLFLQPSIACNQTVHKRAFPSTISIFEGSVQLLFNMKTEGQIDLAPTLCTVQVITLSFLPPTCTWRCFPWLAQSNEKNLYIARSSQLHDTSPAKKLQGGQRYFLK